MILLSPFFKCLTQEMGDFHVFIVVLAMNCYLLQMLTQQKGLGRLIARGLRFSRGNHFKDLLK
jgi:hypothetical protein